MALLTPPPVAPQRGDRSTFANRVDAFITWLINFVSELVNLVANLNSIAAGGAYAIPYVWNAANNAGAMCTSGAATEQQATGFDINNVAQGGVNVLTILQQLNASGSAVRATMRVQKQNDPSRWLLFNVTARTDISNVGYQHLDGIMIAASHADPFAANDLVMLFFQRTGDKGDTGISQTLLLRDQKANGTTAQSLTGGSWNIRALNTTIWNSISSASLSGNVFTLPAGTYWIDAHAAILAGSITHQIRIFNTTTSAPYDGGTSDYGSTSGNVVSRSWLRTVITLTATNSFRIEHWCNANASGGSPASSGLPEIYTEVKITKVA